ncbi:CHAD domain-containing protein [Aquisphaera insulae]|uniref:CHAD domain-containing protein n=1 Tax=Aquisphaera insulae TaxID=2712864 RepID=UPI0013EC2E28|nr:CHAD domain-containing protein [Aquisphaera insulae]
MNPRFKPRARRRAPTRRPGTTPGDIDSVDGSGPANGIHHPAIRVAPLAESPAEAFIPASSPDRPAADLILSAIRGALSRLRAANPPARGGEPEGIHRMRTSSRRLRSELHALRDLIEPEWRQHVEAELKWLAGLLGDVRDLDILENRLQGDEKTKSRATTENVDSPAPARAEPFFNRLHERHHQNSRVLREALDGERYRGLIAELESALETPPLVDEAHQPCRVALPPIARAAWRRLKKGGRGLKTHTPDQAFHDVRKRAKRARYTAELIAPALGPDVQKEARRFIRLATLVQDVLGEHQDAVVAAAELGQFLADPPEDEAAVAEARHLLKSQRKACEKSRNSFFEVWEKLDRKKSTRWIRRAEKRHHASDVQP